MHLKICIPHITFVMWISHINFRCFPHHTLVTARCESRIMFLTSIGINNSMMNTYSYTHTLISRDSTKHPISHDQIRSVRSATFSLSVFDVLMLTHTLFIIHLEEIHNLTWLFHERINHHITMRILSYMPILLIWLRHIVNDLRYLCSSFISNKYLYQWYVMT